MVRKNRIYLRMRGTSPWGELPHTFGRIEAATPLLPLAAYCLVTSASGECISYRAKYTPSSFGLRQSDWDDL